MRARARAQVDRLADVERAPVGVAEHVDAGLVRERGQVRPLAARAARHRRRPDPDLARAEQRERVPDRRRVRAQPPEQRAEHARARARVRQRAVDLVDLDPERARERGQPAAALQRREPARELDRADHRRVGPLERRARERLAQHAHVEARVVGDEHAPAQLRGEPRQHVLGRRRRVDHRLRDAGEALDVAPERLRDADQRRPLLVQLSAADQHRADLGQLAALAAEPVGLGVEGDELGGGEGQVEHGPPSIHPGPDGATARAAPRRGNVRRRAPRRRDRAGLVARRAAASAAARARTSTAPAAARSTMTAAVQDDVIRVSPRTRRRRPDRAGRLQPVRRAADGDVRDRRARRDARRQPREQLDDRRAAAPAG